MSVAAVVLTSCAFGGEAPEPSSAAREERATSTVRLLPDFCSQLVSPLTVASLVERELAGGRSAEYEPPDRSAGLVTGMTCREGVDSRGAAVTIYAGGFWDEPTARRFLRRIASTQSSSGLSTGDQVRVQGKPAVVIDSPAEVSSFVQEGRCAVVVTLRRGTVPDPRSRRTLLGITAAALEGLPDPATSPAG